MFHELTHSTGHGKRPAREGSTKHRHSATRILERRVSCGDGQRNAVRSTGIIRLRSKTPPPISRLDCTGSRPIPPSSVGRAAAQKAADYIRGESGQDSLQRRGTPMQADWHSLSPSWKISAVRIADFIGLDRPKKVSPHSASGQRPARGCSLARPESGRARWRWPWRRATGGIAQDS